MPYGNQPGRDQGGRQRGGGQQNAGPTLDVSRINFREIDPELFNTVAQQCANEVADCRPHINKATQLRKFYDELCMWDTRVTQHEEKFGEYLPFIRMINAKVAYAEGRKLVDRNYVKLLSHCLQQVESAADFRTCKLFMEAFMGFYKSVRPR